MKEHGHYDLAIQDDMLIFTGYGSWNYATTEKWGEEAKRLVCEIKHHPWRCLIDLSQWELVTPDVREYIREVNIWFNTNNLKHLAIVYNISLQKELLKKSNQVFTNVEIEYFTHLDDANRWLDSLNL